MFLVGLDKTKIAQEQQVNIKVANNKQEPVIIGVISKRNGANSAKHKRRRSSHQNRVRHMVQVDPQNIKPSFRELYKRFRHGSNGGSEAQTVRKFQTPEPQSLGET